MSGKVINPKTGRMIEIGKGTYNKLIKEGYVLSGTSLIMRTPLPGPSIQPGTSSLMRPSPGQGAGQLTSQMSSLQISPSPFQPQFQPQPPQLQPQQQPQPQLQLQQQQQPISHNPGVEGKVPDPEATKKELLESTTQERTRMCRICYDYYMKRLSDLRPFRADLVDHKLLKQTIVPACEQCEHLLNQEIRLKGRDPNSFEIYRRYKQAAIRSKQTLSQVDTKMRASGIALASQTETMDPGIFFPKTPDIEPS